MLARRVRFFRGLVKIVGENREIGPIVGKKLPLGQDF